MTFSGLFFSAALCFLQEPKGETERTIDLLEEAVRLSRVRGYSSWTEGDIRERVAEAGREFGRILDLLASGSASPVAASPADGEFDIRPRIVAIAADRRRRPEIYKEIEDYYISTEGIERTPRSLEGRSLQERHAAEKYRLAWEFLLLAPLAGPIFYEEQTIRALQRIRHTDSLAVLVHFYRITCQETSVPSYVATLQSWLLEGLSHFSSYEALAALLECLSASEGLPPKGTGVNAFEPETALRRLWAQWKEGGTELGKAWERILAEQPAERFSPNKAAILLRLRTVFSG